MPPGLRTRARFAQILEDHVAARDVLEDGVGVNEIEFAVGEEREVRTGGAVRVGVGRMAQQFAGAEDHPVGNVDAVNFAEGGGQRAHEAAGAAADLERGGAAGQALEFGRQHLDHVAGGGEELVVVLLLAAEGDVVVGILGRAPVPIRAHLFQKLGVFGAGQTPS